MRGGGCEDIPSVEGRADLVQPIARRLQRNDAFDLSRLGSQSKHPVVRSYEPNAPSSFDRNRKARAADTRIHDHQEYRALGKEAPTLPKRDCTGDDRLRRNAVSNVDNRCAWR